MAGDRYNVIFQGEILENRDPVQVKENIGRIFRMNEEKIEHLFSGLPVTIKRGVDHATALSYMTDLKRVGILCRMEFVIEDQERVSQASEERKDSHISTRRRITCPQCGLEQEVSFECRQCGIIFEKYRPDISHESVSQDNASSITFYDTVSERKQILLLAFLLVILAFVLYQYWTGRELIHSPGILVPSQPLQIAIKNAKPWKVEGKVIVPLALFRLKARVLSKESYRFDQGAALSPIDLALGWGPMSDQQIVDQLDIVQGNRRYVMVPAGNHPPPLPWAVLLLHSANMHMIPADKPIEKRLKSLRVGQIIDLSGYLVGIQEGGRWVWMSSLTRNDSGDGACEVVWVEEVSVE